MKNKVCDWFKSKGSIEILWSFIGGMMFSFLPILTNTGTKFNLSYWWRLLTKGHRYVGSGVQDEFIFGFLLTFILIWTIKRYRSLT